MMQPCFDNERVVLYQCDCLDLMSTLANGSIDLTVTSPPYDNLRNYNGYSFPFEQIAQELYRVTKNGGVVIWNVGDATVDGSETCTSMRQALAFLNIGFRLHDTMIYHKLNPLPSAPTAKRYQQAWEYVFCFSCGAPSTFNPIMVKAKYGHLAIASGTRRNVDGTREIEETKRNEFTKVSNVFSYPIGGGITTTDKIAFQHPALMPEALARDQILTWSNPGDLVFDPFAGAGTTAKMAGLATRRFVGAEISQTYCNIAVARLKAHIGNIPLDI